MSHMMEMELEEVQGEEAPPPAETPPPPVLVRHWSCRVLGKVLVWLVDLARVLLWMPEETAVNLRLFSHIFARFLLYVLVGAFLYGSVAALRVCLCQGESSLPVEVMEVFLGSSLEAVCCCLTHDESDG